MHSNIVPPLPFFSVTSILWGREGSLAPSLKTGAEEAKRCVFPFFPFGPMAARYRNLSCVSSFPPWPGRMLELSKKRASPFLFHLFQNLAYGSPFFCLPASNEEEIAVKKPAVPFFSFLPPCGSFWLPDCKPLRDIACSPPRLPTPSSSFFSFPLDP